MRSDLLNSLGIGWLLTMAMWGTGCLIVSVVDYLQEWRHARRTLNTEVPALRATVKELQARQTRLEAELARYAESAKIRA